MYDYKAAILANADPKYASFSSSLIPGRDDLVGVRIPVLRSIAKEIVKDGWRGFLEAEPGCFEEEMLRAIVIATAPMDAEERIAFADRFIPGIDNWSVCDSMCCSFKFKKDEAERVWDWAASLMDTGEEFPMRVSAVLRMSRFRDAEHIPLLLEDLMARDHPGYYYRMGAAWAVSDCYVHCPDAARRALESRRLPAWVQNKSIQKIRESFRVSDEDKQALLELKIKEKK